MLNCYTLFTHLLIYVVRLASRIHDPLPRAAIFHRCRTYKTGRPHSSYTHRGTLATCCWCWGCQKFSHSGITTATHGCTYDRPSASLGNLQQMPHPVVREQNNLCRLLHCSYRAGISSDESYLHWCVRLVPWRCHSVCYLLHLQPFAQRFQVIADKQHDASREHTRCAAKYAVYVKLLNSFL